MSKHLDAIRKRSRKVIKEDALKSSGELDSGSTKGVGLPQSSPASHNHSLASTGELDTKDTKGVGLRREEEDPKKDNDKKFSWEKKKEEVKEMVGAEQGGVVDAAKAAETTVSMVDALPAPMVQGVADSNPAKHPAVTEQEEDDEFDFDLDEEVDAEDEDKEKVAESEEVDAEDEKKKEAVKEQEDAEKEKEDKKEIQEHIEALLAGENLPKSFRSKVETVFEAAVKARVKRERGKIVEQAKRKLRTIKKNLHEELAGQLDSYLDYVVEQWMEQNRVSVEHSLRTELTEDFISDLRVLFERHNIDVPKAQYNLVDELQVSLDEAEHRLNEEIRRGVQLKNKIRELEKDIVIREAAEGLTSVEADKFRTLAESVSFDDVADLKSKAKQLRESYFRKGGKSASSVNVLVEDDNGNAVGIAEAEGEGKPVTNDAMSAYVGAVRQLKTK